MRAQAGGDRLVMVISHLHAVAEAVDEVVDDVLGVECRAARSVVWIGPDRTADFGHA
ncbi:hypothetical protein [Nocardia sp. NPDC004750]